MTFLSVGRGTSICFDIVFWQKVLPDEYVENNRYIIAALNLLDRLLGQWWYYKRNLRERRKSTSVNDGRKRYIYKGIIHQGISKIFGPRCVDMAGLVRRTRFFQYWSELLSNRGDPGIVLYSDRKNWKFRKIVGHFYMKMPYFSVYYGSG